MAKQAKIPATPGSPLPPKPPVPFVHITVDTGTDTPDGLTADPKVFSSGKPGFWGQARWTIGGERYMVQLQVVKIVPKQ